MTIWEYIDANTHTQTAVQRIYEYGIVLPFTYNYKLLFYTWTIRAILINVSVDGSFERV